MLRVELDWVKLEEFSSRKFVEVVRLAEEGLVNECSREIIDFYIDFTMRFHEFIGDNLEELLEDTFLVPRISELVGPFADLSQVRIMYNDKTLVTVTIDRKDNLNIQTSEKAIEELKRKLKCQVQVIGERLLVKLLLDHEKVIHSFTCRLDDEVNFIREMVAGIPLVMVNLFGYAPYVFEVLIVPDGRAGILRTIDALSRALITTKWRIPTINAVDREFFREIMTLKPTVVDKEIAKKAEMIERELQVKFLYDARKLRAAVYDEAAKVQLPLEKSPSGIRELAPIIYLMKYALEPYSMLFIEEPEAHLHPDAQSIVIRALARLIKHHVLITITTHSSIVLDELNNLITLKELPSEIKRKLGYYEDEGLDPEDINIYTIKRLGEAVKMSITEDGISETDMDFVLGEIANKHVSVKEALDYLKSRGAKL